MEGKEDCSHLPCELSPLGLLTPVKYATGSCPRTAATHVKEAFYCLFLIPLLYQSMAYVQQASEALLSYLG
ncbi:hypothetical protein Krac_5511 [Ktedonobacter racemifer DSM 44963]|uniref:Uncharacterized protein n=1 Tax=Ktedonobacter racemifer DSM 44963 TaxID=485913 RepID=D6TW80_KTERA|nr:hypothetical protein Krac_5511 [Ktedonobacter racemifer DSM 44963]